MLSTETYMLPTGAELVGYQAAAARALDELDPLETKRDENTFTDSQTRNEILHYLGTFYWCSSLNRGVVPRDTDMWEEITEDVLFTWVTDFLHARIRWIQAMIDQSESPYAKDADAKAYKRYAQSADSSYKAAQYVKDIKLLRNIDVNKLNRSESCMGTPQGVLDIDAGLLATDSQLLESEYSVGVAYSPEEVQSMMITKSIRATPVRFLDQYYKPFTRWNTFLDEITDGDTEKAEFLKRALGYSLIAGNPQKATFVLWGATRDNGKSTLMNAIKHVLGDYAASIEPDIILSTSAPIDASKPQPTLAKLPGIRLVDMSEPPAGVEINGAKIKKFASGVDEISCRQLRQTEFSYIPEFTIWMHCNELPLVADPSVLDPEHMFVIEFNRRFTGRNKQLNLPELFKTQSAMSTIFAWLLDGYFDYTNQGLNPPKSVLDATQQWLYGSTHWTDRFVKEMCEIGSDKRCLVSEFREVSSIWCEQHGLELSPARQVNRKLKRYNVNDVYSNHVHSYRGIELTARALSLLGSGKK